MHRFVVTLLVIGFCTLAGCGAVSDGAFAPHPPTTEVKPLSAVLYSFGPLPDAEYPIGGLVAGKMGEYYGTATSGGSSGNCKPGCGAVYDVTAAGTENVLYSFQGVPDGANPQSSLIMDKNGALYGVTAIGGNDGSSCGYADGCGTVFKLTSSKQGWTERVLYAFQGGADGRAPVGDLVMTRNGALLGTTLGGGYDDMGTIFELTRSGSIYTEKIVHEFSGGADGLYPTNGLDSDINGNLYGTTSSGGLPCGCGTAFKLASSSSTYSYSVIYSFKGGADGATPSAGLLPRSNGVLYGVTAAGGTKSGADGTIFELTPKGSGYLEKVLYSFQGGADGSHPDGRLVADRNNNLYGTTTDGGTKHCSRRKGCGTVFKLAHFGKRFTEDVLYVFQGGKDGAYPQGGVVIDGKSNLLGPTYEGGGSRTGTVFSLCCAPRLGRMDHEEF